MDNFDKLFQEKLGEIKETDFTFKASAWANFQKKWHQENADDEISAPFLWRRRHFFSVAALALLLCGNAFFAAQTFRSQSQIQSLTQKVKTLEQEIVACAERQTTNFNTSTSEKAILNQNNAFANSENNNNFGNNGSTNNAFANQNQNNAFANSENNNNFGNNGSANNAFANQNQNNAFANSENNNNFGNNGSANNAFANQNQNNTFANTKEDSATVAAEKSAEIVIPLAENILKLGIANVTAPLSPPPFRDSPTLPARKPTFGEQVIKLQQAAAPSDFRLGLTSQVAFLPIVPRVVAPVLMQQHGINADALFFDRLRLKVGANYWRQIYNIDDIERRPDGILNPILSNLPTAQPTQTDDVLTKFEAKVFGVDVPLTLQILLTPEKRFSPYLGIGVVGRYYHSYQTEHYFLQNTVPYEGYEIKNNQKKEQWNWGIWQGQFGFDYRLTERWGFNFELNYLQSHQAQPFGRADMRQFGSGLGVQFTF